MDRTTGLTIVNIENQSQVPYIQALELKLEAIEKGGYDSFMLKEIHEQPRSIEDSIRGRVNLKTGLIKMSGIDEHEERWKTAQRILIVACGTSWHAGLVAEYLFEDFARIPVEVEYASEFRYRNPIIYPSDIVIAISQSGETADTLAALGHAQSQKQHTLAVLNVPNSSMDRLADTTCLTYAGPEIGVASTKAFTAQLWVLMRLVIEAGIGRGTFSADEAKDLMAHMTMLPSYIDETLACETLIKKAAQRLKNASSALYLGRGPFYPLALEGALKLKEISYIHAEGYAAGEIKHGPIALIEPGTPVVVLAPSGSFFDKTASAIEEVLARGADTLIITDPAGHHQLNARQKPYALVLPQTPEALTPFTQAVALQLLAYHVALLKGKNVDLPRNLPKSVTVE